MLRGYTDLKHPHPRVSPAEVQVTSELARHRIDDYPHIASESCVAICVSGKKREFTAMFVCQSPNLGSVRQDLFGAPEKTVSHRMHHTVTVTPLP